MTPARIALSFIALLLSILLIAAVYFYQNLPVIVEQQAKRLLQDYGMQSLNYERLEVSHEQLQTASLKLRGEYDGFAYEATVSGLRVQYDWKMLLIGRVQAVTIDKLELFVQDQGSKSEPGASDQLEISSLLPQAYLDDLPLASLGIKQWQLNYNSTGLPPVSVSGSLLLEEHLRLDLKTSYGGSDLTAHIWTEENGALPSANFNLNTGDTAIAKLTATLNPGKIADWQWSLTGSVEYAPLLSWLHQLNLAPQLQLSLEIPDGLIVEGRSNFSALLDHPEKLDMAQIFDDLSLQQFVVQFSSDNQLKQLDYPGVVHGLATAFDLSVDTSSEQTQITLGPTELKGQLSIGQLSLPPELQSWLRWADTVPVQWRTAEAVTIETSGEKPWSFELHNNELQLGDKQSQLRWHQLNLNAAVAHSDMLELEIQFNARLQSRFQKIQLPETSIDASHSGTLSHSIFSLTLDDIAESMHLALSGDVNIDTGLGNYHAQANSQDLAYASSSVIPLLQSFGIAGKREILTITGGSVNLDSKINSRGFALSDLTQSSLLTVSNFSGAYQDYQFKGLDLSANWLGIEQWQTNQPVNLAIESLDMGFEVTDIKTQFSLPRPTSIEQAVVNLESLSCRMFGGRVYLPEPSLWDFTAASNNFSLRAEDWQLADMVALQQGQDIQAQGVLEGELPVTVTGGRIIIEGGYLRALPPGGSIRYVADEASQALAASSPELGLALDLLSDFQYEVLRSQVELDEEGNLLLGLSLAGKNPAQYEGRPINFNINLEQNLDPLLQSLRLSDKLVEQLEGRIN